MLDIIFVILIAMIFFIQKNVAKAMLQEKLPIKYDIIGSGSER